MLLLFVIPLAFTLSGFLLWIMYSLNGFYFFICHKVQRSERIILATITYLRSRKQRYKVKMFERLYYILVMAVIIIGIFFIVSSMSFSGRLAEGPHFPVFLCLSLMRIYIDYAAKSWRVRWWLLDGWLALLYFVTYVSIAWLWRPTANNRRYAFSSSPLKLMLIFTFIVYISDVR